MKKVILLVLLVMLASTLLMASGPSLRIVKLTIINKSGNEVCLRLEGSELGKQFYYLCVPAGTKSFPYVKVFTVLEDIYTRTTYIGEGANSACVGITSTGQLIMDRNVRLTFVPCFSTPTRTFWWDGKFYSATNNGEPSMEKVVYFQRLNLVQAQPFFDSRTWATGDGYYVNVYWKRGCGFNDYYWRLATTRVPTRGLCQWRYLYDSTHQWAY